MKITVIGPGAMGCLFAGLLARSKAKHDVWLLDKYPQRAKKIGAKGLKVEGLSNFNQAIKASADAKAIGISGLVIVFTKSYDTESALTVIKPLLGENTNVLSLQNGLGNIELISEFVGEGQTIGGTTSYGATLLDIGRTRHAGKGETIIGKPTGKIYGDLRQVSALLNEAGIPTRISKDINSVIWSKLIINSSINALSAICGLSNGLLLNHEGAKELLRQAAVEAIKVAKRKKVKLIYEDPLQKVESVCRATSANISSMLQDVMHKKPTEIDSINGAIIRQGKSCGVKTPVNEMLLQLIKTIESSYEDRARI